ncbi:MAG: DUF1549 domain-containing protein, partial [Planctomycetota bacterium]|nr:DUF1549 domain-containing protein [Planctomycetota bacterium]
MPIRPLFFVGLMIACGVIEPALGAPKEPASTSESVQKVYFGTDVVPILTKLGCNGGGCHGKATGQNGFKLSLFGFEPKVDYEAIVKESRGRRLSFAAPENSLLLTKATASTPHGGGRRLEKDSDDYRILRNWISEGATAPRDDDPQLLRIEISPQEQILKTGSSQQLQVTARFTDGNSRDVTHQAVYQANEPGIATVNEHGLIQIKSKHGLFAVMARFGDQIATFHAAVPFASKPSEIAVVERKLQEMSVQVFSSHVLSGAEGNDQPEAHPVDRYLIAQWRRLKVVPSALADDATFLRRVTIDICGTLPTNDEVLESLADTRNDKRERLIDSLLQRAEYASSFTLKWADILQNRGAGYSTSKQRAGTTLFAEWIRDSLEANKPYDQFVAEILTATGSQNENPPTIW